jgi:hypothetical protein
VYWRSSNNGGIRHETIESLMLDVSTKRCVVSTASAVCLENARNREMTCVRGIDAYSSPSMEWARSRFDLIVKTLWPLVKLDQVAIKHPPNPLTTFTYRLV